MRHLPHLIVLLILFLLTGCSKKEVAITDLKGLSGGKIFAVPTGTAADQFVLKKVKDAKIIYFNNALDCALAVKAGKADAAVYDKPILLNIAAKNEGLTVLSELIADDQYGFAVQMENRELKTAIDQVLVDLKSDGTYEEMSARWFPAKGAPAAMPEITLDGTNGVLRFGTAAVTEPMSFIDANRKVVGFDVEFATYVAKKLGRQIEIVDMEFGAMLPSLISGKVDMIGAGLSITGERAKKVLFSESYYPSGLAVVVRSPAIQQEKSSVIQMSGIEDVGDKRIGVLLGSCHDSYATKNHLKATILRYQNSTDLLLALANDKVDAAYYDHACLQDVLPNNPGLGILQENVFFAEIGAAFNEENDGLREQFNTFLKEIKGNGVYDDMVHRWMGIGDTRMPEIPNAKNNGKLLVGIVSDAGMPFTVIKDGSLIGFDIELPLRFAAYLGKEFVPVDLQFGSIIASLSTRKIDMTTCSMMINEEREKMVDFSDSYYASGISILARKENIKPAAAARLSKLEDIADKKVGIFSGTVHDAYMAQHYPKAQVLRYDGTADMMLSLKTGKIDAAMFDLVTAGIIMRQNPELGLLSDKVFSMPLGVGFSKDNASLRDEFNSYLKKIRQDGTYDIMHDRWFKEDPEKAVMPDFKNPSSGKKLTVGVSAEDLPYVIFMNGKYAGFDIEMIEKFAGLYNYNLTFINIEFPALIPALASGKVDMISDGIAISQERAKQIDFSDSYATFETAVIAAKKDLPGYKAETVAKVKKSFLKSVSDSFYSNIVLENRYLLILDGLKITVIISFFAAIFGTLIGGLICFMKMSKKKLVSALASIYISLIRGTPVLVLLMIIFYIIFASVNINPVFVAVIAFGINFGAYVSEMFRTSIESVDRGQREAGIASGFTKVQTFIYIIFPQALRHVLPVYKGEFISLVKMTSIVGYIAVQDLTKASDIIRSRTFDAFFPLIMAAVIYILIAWLLTWALSYVEISVDPKRKRIKRVQEEGL